MIEFTLDLPVEELYCPALACSVYDQVFMGFSQPLLGTFTVEIGKIMQKKIKERKETIETGNRLLEYLDSIIGGGNQRK